MTRVFLTGLSLIVLTLAGCATDRTIGGVPLNWKTCGAAGAVGGGVIGATDSTEGALIGAAIGGLIGALVCREPATATDTDGDGVPDKNDQCVGTPQGAKVDATGCEPDSDGDGVPDSKDMCAGTPKNARVTAAGCEPVADSDRDGVPDNRDACPNTPNGTAVDARGCPPDRDADGVPDSADQCAGTPAGRPVDPRGCELDADGDGVPDGADRCPDTPAGSAVDADGCPRVSDADADGIADDKDRCPGTAAGAAVGPDGCPAARVASTRMVLQGVTFESGSARLTTDSSKALDQVAASLEENAGAQVEIAGYTDNTGSAALNRRLSMQRAEAVRAYLISKGVDGTRLTARGYGPDAPVADNSTEQGRAANRRVELKIR